MLPAYALLVFLASLLVSEQAYAFDRSYSTDPRVTPPAPYGLNLVRPEHRQIIEDHQREVPAGHSIEVGRVAVEVERLEVEAGPYAIQLTQPLIDLGTRYRNGGHAQQAIDIYKHAMHVLRINHGLDTPLQIPLLMHLIDGHLALGNYKEADQKQSALYNLKLHLYREEDPLQHAAIEHFADWQRSAYLANLGKNKYRRLLEIHNLYANMTEVKARLSDENDPALVPLLYKQMHVQYLISLYDGEKQDVVQVKNTSPGGAGPRISSAAEMQFVTLQNDNFRKGKRTMARILEIYQHNPHTPTSDIANAIIALGDWHIWFGRQAAAQRRYKEAFELLAANENGAMLIDKNFGKPMELPTSSVFQPGRIAPRVKHKGEVVMRFTVTKYGKARKIKTIVADSAMGETDIGRRPSKLLKQVRFRPRMEAGKMVSTEGLERRYFVSY